MVVLCGRIPGILRRLDCVRASRRTAARSGRTGELQARGMYAEHLVRVMDPDVEQQPLPARGHNASLRAAPRSAGQWQRRNRSGRAAVSVLLGRSRNRSRRRPVTASIAGGLVGLLCGATALLPDDRGAGKIGVLHDMSVARKAMAMAKQPGPSPASTLTPVNCASSSSASIWHNITRRKHDACAVCCTASGTSRFDRQHSTCP